MRSVIMGSSLTEALSIFNPEFATGITARRDSGSDRQLGRDGGKTDGEAQPCGNEYNFNPLGACRSKFYT